ncbi:MAG: hypothetical protein ACKOOG_01450, partial [Actinomycetota bacterium]
MRTRRLTPALVLGLVLAVSLAATAVAAATPGDKVWQSTFNGPGLTDEGRSITRSRDGATVIITGNGSPAVGDPSDIVTVAYDAATGAQRWVRRIVGSVTNGNETASGIVASPTADLVFVTGNVASATGYNNWRVTAYAIATGNVVWTRGFAGSDGLDDRPGAITVGPGGGRVYVTGTEEFGSGGQAIRTISYDAATGATAWSRLAGNADTDAFSSGIGVSPGGGRVLVVGGYNDGDGRQAFVASYQAGPGALQWTRQIPRAPGLNPAETSYDSFTGVGVSPDGTRVFAAGDTTTGGSTNAILVVSLAASTGTPQWTVRRPENATGYAAA